MTEPPMAELEPEWLQPVSCFRGNGPKSLRTVMTHSASQAGNNMATTATFPVTFPDGEASTLLKSRSGQKSNVCGDGTKAAFRTISDQHHVHHAARPDAQAVESS